MKRSLLAAALGAPLLLSLALIGCGRPVDKDETSSNQGGEGTPQNGTPVKKDLQPLEGKAGAVLKGKVTLKNKPDVSAMTKEFQTAILSKPDQKATCFDMAPDAEKSEQKLIADASGGVGNVVVWIQPPEGSYFKVNAADKTWPDKVELTQPHCAFIPHISCVVPFLVDPSDPKKTVPSGQKFTVSNTADISHNTKWDTVTGASNQNQLGVLQAHTEPKEVDLKGNNTLVHFSCNIHGWMDAYVWVFNHPYAAVTKPDGTFEIKNVPAGSKVRITAWHEMGPNSGYLTGSKIKGDEIQLEADKPTEHNFEFDALAGQ